MGQFLHRIRVFLFLYRFSFRYPIYPFRCRLLNDKNLQDLCWLIAIRVIHIARHIAKSEKLEV